MEITSHYDHIATECVCCSGKHLMRSQAILMPFISHRVYNWEPALIDNSWGLQTIPLGYAYALCNSLLCSKCGLLFLDIRFSELEMARLYKNYRDEAYSTLRELYEPGYRLRNEGLIQGVNYLQEVEEFLRPYLPNTLRVLDWGGDSGINTPFKEGEDNEIHIYDISGIEAIEKFHKVSIETAKHFKYDLIVCSNVLEHIPYPSQMLSEIKTMMSDGSVLYIEVPLENHVKEFSDTRLLLEKKRHWHEHINFFSENALRMLVFNLGFEMLSFEIKIFKQNNKLYNIFMLACRLQKI